MSNYQEHTTGSKSWVKRWLHQERFVTSLELLNLSNIDRLFDYGCGDGEFSLRAKKLFPEVEIVAFDPVEELYLQAVERLKSTDVKVIQRFDPDVGEFDKVSCLETVEHLPPKELEELFNNIQTLLKPKGVCLFTFPIEHGAMSFFKNTYRILAGRDKYSSFGRALSQFFSLYVPREPVENFWGHNYIFSHIGFNARAMIKEIEKRFQIVRIRVLPFGTLFLGLGNSVAVLVKKKVA